MSSSTRYHFTVPPTAEQGSYSGNCSASYMESYRANALSQYNSARAHDGLEPLSRMPRGTRYTRKTAPFVVTIRDRDTGKTSQALIP